MAKITSVIIGDTGTQAKDKINEAIETVESNTTLTGDGNVATPLAVNPDLVLDTLQLSGGSGTEGTASWNTDELTWDIIQNGTTLQVGQEIQYNARNNSGVAIADGEAVMATGTIGASGRITIAKMNNDGTIEPELFMGIATEDIANGADGKITHFGKIRGIQTNGANYGEVWADGDLIYLDTVTDGALTNVQPEAYSYKASVAIVVNAHATNGTLFVRVSGNEGVHDLHDVQADSPSNGDLLQYNTSNGRWENVTVASLKQAETAEVVIGQIDTDFTAATNVAWFLVPWDCDMTDIYLDTGTAATGATLIVDVNLGKSGTSIMTTDKLVIDIGETSTRTAATPPVLTTTSFSAGDQLWIDRDQVGSTIAGKDGIVTFEFTRT